jgi:hypothetical protein
MRTATNGWLASLTGENSRCKTDGKKVGGAGTIMVSRRFEDVGWRREAMSVISLSKGAPAQRTPAARLKRYRALAAPPRHQGEGKTDAQHSFLVVAHYWEGLAADMESNTENG